MKVSNYTPINEFKLSKEAKEFIAKCRKMKAFPVKRIVVSPKIFSDILDGISPTLRSLYSDAIPFEGKMLVRK